jgi:N-acyl-D-amino-acid deacylase
MSHAGRVRAAFMLALIPFMSLAQERYDLVLRNGLVVDGSGGAPFRADVAVRGDQIARIAPDMAAAAARTIDATGQVISPGFIDIHVHATRGTQMGLFEVPTAGNYIRQGVTTILDGPDGGSPVPLAPFLARLEMLPKSINIGTFIGQGSIREAVVGLGGSAGDPRRDREDAGPRRRGHARGAFGLSSGLFYVPGTASVRRRRLARHRQRNRHVRERQDDRGAAGPCPAQKLGHRMFEQHTINQPRQERTV